MLKHIPLINLTVFSGLQVILKNQFPNGENDRCTIPSTNMKVKHTYHPCRTHVLENLRILNNDLLLRSWEIRQLTAYLLTVVGLFCCCCTFYVNVWERGTPTNVMSAVQLTYSISKNCRTGPHPAALEAGGLAAAGIVPASAELVGPAAVELAEPAAPPYENHPPPWTASAYSPTTAQ